MKKLISFILLATVSVGQSLGQSLYNEDSLHYFEEIRIRREDSQRAEMAAIIKAFSTWSEAVGVELSAENTPILWYLVITCAQKGNFLERHFNEDPDGLPEHERLQGYGHSSFLAGVTCAILLELLPSKAALIIKRGANFCASRFSLECRPGSDIFDDYLFGFQVVSVLHSDPTFQATIRAAKYEVQKQLFQHDVERYPYKGEQHKLRPYE